MMHMGLAHQPRRRSSLRRWRPLLDVSPDESSTAPPHLQDRHGHVRPQCPGKMKGQRQPRISAGCRCVHWRWHLQQPGWRWAQETVALRPSESHARGPLRRFFYIARKRSWVARHALPPLGLETTPPLPMQACRSRSLPSRIPDRRRSYPAPIPWHAGRRSKLSGTRRCFQG